MVVVSKDDHSQPSLRLLISTLIFVSCGLIYSCFVNPLRQELNEIQKEISDLGLAVSEKEERENLLAHSAALIQQQQKYLDTQLTFLQRGPIGVLHPLQELASAKKISISWRTPTKTKSLDKDGGGPFSFRVLNLELEGRYPALRDYLESLSQTEYLLGIQSFELEAIKNTSHSSCLHAKLALVVPCEDSLPQPQAR